MTRTGSFPLRPVDLDTQESSAVSTAGSRLQTRKQYLPCDVPHRTIEENLDEYPDEHRPSSPPVRCKMPKRKDQRIVSQPSVEPRRPRIEPYCDLTLDTDRLVPYRSTAGFSGRSGITRVLGFCLVEEPQKPSHLGGGDFGSWSAPENSNRVERWDQELVRVNQSLLACEDRPSFPSVDLDCRIV